MKFEFDTKDLTDPQSYGILAHIVKVYEIAPVVVEGDKWATIKPISSATITPIASQPTTLQNAADNIIYDETGPSAPGAISSEGVIESTPTAEPAKPGRKKKSTAAQAAELVAALKAPPTPLEKAIEDVVKESGGVISVEVVPAKSSDDFDLMSLASPSSAPKAEEAATPTDHQKLVDAVRVIMMDRGHVWMRNVLEKHKKVAKSLPEFTDEILNAILENPDAYNELV